MKSGVTLVVALLLTLSLLMPSDSTAQTQTGSQDQEGRIRALETSVDRLERAVASLQTPRLPATMSLCGQQLPLSDIEIREKVEKEFYLFLEKRGTAAMVLKRYYQFYPILSKEIEAAGMPTDLIFLAVAESHLNPRISSPAAASGLWQFIRETGKRHGLTVGNMVDERFSVTRSTRSAMRYFKNLYAEFGDWFLVMAAYNAGEARVRSTIANQNSKNFFDLFLPAETDRYVYRIAVIKEVLSNPQRYGFSIDPKEAYKTYGVAEVTIRTEHEIHSSLLAKAMGLPYRTFREYNLHIREYEVPKGTYPIYVPDDRKGLFLTQAGAIPGVTVEKD